MLAGYFLFTSCMYHSHYICVGKIGELFNFVWCCINKSPSIAFVIVVREALVCVCMCMCVCVDAIAFIFG